MLEPIVISFSEIDTYRQCPHKHDLGYLQRWQSPDQSPPLARGTAWHQMLEVHYQVIRTHVDGTDAGDEAASFAATDAVLEVLEKIEDDDQRDLLAWMYIGYRERYGLDRDWEVLAVEHESRVPLRFASGRASRFVLKVKIDLIVRDRFGRVWLVDHKSHAQIPKDKELDLDVQFGLYAWALRSVGHQVHGMVYSTARTQRNKGPMSLDERFNRHLMVREQSQLDTIAAEALDTARKMHPPASLARMIPRERHPNPDTCRWRCPYTEPCLFGTKYGDAREREFLLDTGFIQDFTRH